MNVSQYGIVVNPVAPGIIRSRLTQRISNRDALEARTKFIPVGRLGEPKDIAAAVAFLASDDEAFISGAMLVVDGGMSVVASRDL